MPSTWNLHCLQRIQALEMAGSALMQRVESLEVDEPLEALSDGMTGRCEILQARMESVEKRVETLEVDTSLLEVYESLLARVESAENRIEEHNTSIHHLGIYQSFDEKRIDRLYHCFNEKRIDKIENLACLGVGLICFRVDSNN